MFFFEHPRLFFSVQPVAAWLALAPRSTAGAWYVGSGTTYDRLVSLRPALSTKASTQRTEGGSASPVDMDQCRHSGIGCIGRWFIESREV
jgi:hypothetical protein